LREKGKGDGAAGDGGGGRRGGGGTGGGRGRGCGESQRCAESRFFEFLSARDSASRAISYMAGQSRRNFSLHEAGGSNRFCGRFRGGASFFGDESRSSLPFSLVTLAARRYGAIDRSVIREFRRNRGRESRWRELSRDRSSERGNLRRAYLKFPRRSAATR